MSAAVSTFVFDDDQPHAIRVIDRAGEPWFVAKDVCAVLGIKDASDAVEPLDDDEADRVSIPIRSSVGGRPGPYSTGSSFDQNREVLIVTEGGLYTLILRSRQATTPGTPAHRFRKWVTGELLPQIRKTGRYSLEDGPQFDWEEIDRKGRLIDRARLTLGRKAAAELWRELGLPMPDLNPQPAQRTGALQGLDFVRQFLADRTDDAPGGRVQARELHKAYAAWASATSSPPMTERALAMCLDAIGIQKSRASFVHYIGIRIKHLSEITG